jgi:hypothetical protein
MQRNEKAEESCGNGSQLRRLRRGKVENQRQVSHFPTAISLLKTGGSRAGFALRPAQRRFAPAASAAKSEQSVIVAEKRENC